MSGNATGTFKSRDKCNNKPLWLLLLLLFCLVLQFLLAFGSWHVRNVPSCKHVKCVCANDHFSCVQRWFRFKFKFLNFKFEENFDDSALKSKHLRSFHATIKTCMLRKECKSIHIAQADSVAAEPMIALGLYELTFPTETVEIER